MSEITGVDTIYRLVDSPPKKIKIKKSIIIKGVSLLREWNASFLAFIPYCCLCREPLNWYSPPTEEGFIFRCSKCNRKWKIITGEKAMEGKKSANIIQKEGHR